LLGKTYHVSLVHFDSLPHEIVIHQAQRYSV
jgi:hypothetical protein